MELEKWITEHDIKKMAKKNYEFYIDEFKNNFPEEYEEVFQDIDDKETDIVLYNAGYILYCCEDEEQRRYISVKLRVKSNNKEFLDYEVIYDLDGNYDDDFLNACED